MTKAEKRPRREQPLYTISIASRLTGLAVHTIRWLEANELLSPSRTHGNQRLFSDVEIDQLRELAALLERRVNVAGIRVILTIKRTYRLSRIEVWKED